MPVSSAVSLLPLPYHYHCLYYCGYGQRSGRFSNTNRFNTLYLPLPYYVSIDKTSGHILPVIHPGYVVNYPTAAVHAISY